MRCLREEEEQRELERQFIAQLERKRQERLNVEQMRNQRARALEELKQIGKNFSVMYAIRISQQSVP